MVATITNLHLFYVMVSYENTSLQLFAFKSLSSQVFSSMFLKIVSLNTTVMKDVYF